MTQAEAQRRAEVDCTDFELAGQFKRFEDAGEVHAVNSMQIRFTPGVRLVTT